MIDLSIGKLKKIKKIYFLFFLKNFEKSVDKSSKILYDINVPMNKYRKRRGSGGIGRRAGFRCLW